MKEPSDKDIVYSKNVIEFITVVNEYCLFIEKAEDYSKDDIIQYMLKICPLIYLKGALLPAGEENEQEITERYVTEEHWESVYKAVLEKLGKDDAYWSISSTETGENMPMKFSIAENLTDIYQDFKDFIMLYQKGTHAAKENAVAECRQLFGTHWGIRLINAHKALHHIIYPENISGEFFENDN
jgi:hypothetical protein